MTAGSPIRAEDARALQERLAKFQQKERLIALLKTAAGAPNPSLFAAQVRAIDAAWLASGDIGPATTFLDVTYQMAVLEFDKAVLRAAREKPRSEAEQQSAVRIRRGFGIR